MIEMLSLSKAAATYGPKNCRLLVEVARGFEYRGLNVCKIYIWDQDMWPLKTGELYNNIQVAFIIGFTVCIGRVQNHYIYIYIYIALHCYTSVGRAPKAYSSWVVVR